MTLEQVKDAVREADPALSEDDTAFDTATMMLGMATLDRITVTEVVDFTGLPRDFVAPRMSRLRESGILWPRTGRVREIRANWFADGGGMDFWLDVTVAEGLVTRAPA